MAWFGPKGVATMTFALFVLGSAVAEAERIAAIAALTVFVSIIVHGLTDQPGLEWMANQRADCARVAGMMPVPRAALTWRTHADLGHRLARRRAPPARGAALGRGDARDRHQPARGRALQEHQVHERAWVVVAAGEA